MSHHFTLEGDDLISRVLLRFNWIFKQKEGSIYVYCEKRKELNQNYSYGDYDLEIFEATDWTHFEGSFASFSYFDRSRESVLKWFALRPEYRAKLSDIEKLLPEKVSDRCCIHIRRGDFLWHDKGLAYRDMGWSLPLEYYHQALRRLPDNLFYVIANDDPEYAEKIFLT